MQDDLQSQRPSTAPDASVENGQGELSMTVFVRTYMMSILQPFASNVEELHNVVTGLSNDLAETTNKADQNGGILMENAATLATLRADLNRTTEQASTTQSLLETTREEKTALFEDHEATKVRLGDVDRRLVTAQGSVEELQASLKDTRWKLSKLRETQAEMERSIARDLNPSIDRLTANLAALDGAYNQTVQILSDTKSETQTNTKELTEFTRRYNENNDKNDHAFERITSRFQTLDERVSEAYRHLQDKDDQDALHKEQLESLKARMNAGDVAHRENQDRLNRADIAMTDHSIRASEVDKNIKELLQFKDYLSSGRDLNAIVDILTEGQRRHADDLTNLLELTDKHTQNLLQHAERLSVGDEVRDNLQARMKRCEKTIGLEPYRKEEIIEGIKQVKGQAFTQEQLRAFQTIFDEFDSDGGGSITPGELGDVMRKLGQNPTQEMLATMVDEVDADGSGEIEFDEFCTLMAKSMGKDGKIDTSKGAQSAIDNMSLLAKQKQALETINLHTSEIRRNLQEIESLKAMPTIVRVENLEKRHALMEEDVSKMGQGLELTKEYWKGLTKGLKETKRTVNMDGEMLPSASRLRTSLPAIAKRPGTSGSMTAR